MNTRRLLTLSDLDFKKGNGLLPVIVQDQRTLKVLTLAYANEEAIEKTLATGYAHYYRRSLRKVVKKGETSGNVQEVKDILADCDSDTILYLVKPKGPACHLGGETCFYRKLTSTI